MKNFNPQLFLIVLFTACLSSLSAKAQALDAINDYAHRTLGDANGIVYSNVLSNDFNGTTSPVAPNLVTITVLSQSSPYVNLVNRNVVTSFPGGILQAGTYTIQYQICRVNNPSICDTAIATLFINDCQTTPAPQIALVPNSPCLSQAFSATGLPAAGWIAKIKQNGNAYRTQTGSGTSATLSTLPSGSYIEVAVVDLATGCQSPYVGLETPNYDCGITTVMTGTFQDFNNDGIVSPGDKFNYTILLTNNIGPGWGIDDAQLTGGLPASITYTTTLSGPIPPGGSYSGFSASYTINQADINRGYVHAELGIYTSHGIHDYFGNASTNTWFPVLTPTSAVLSGGATICNGDSANLSVAITGGTPPFTVVYSDGSSNATVSNYSSGNPIAVNPTANTTYTLVSVTSTNATPIANLSGTANINVQQLYPFFADADGDGYGTGSAVNLCAADANAVPAGYSLIGGDCDDDDNDINPEATEILYNGIDDNCSGQMDEGHQITTSLLPSFCNTTVASMNTLIGITTLAPAAAYNGWRIRLTNGAQVQIIERNVPNFSLGHFPTYSFATTYTVEIELRRNGVWLGYYGPACQITSPAVVSNGPIAQISPSQCGITLAQINTLIATTSIAGVTGYRFRVTNLTDTSGPNAVQTIDRTQNWFSLPMLTRYNYGTTYRIEVALKIGSGVFGNYGTACEVSSPAVPQLTNCNATVSNGTSYVSTNSLGGVTQYRFEVKRASDNATTLLDRNTPYFIFNAVPAVAFTAGAQYHVRIAVMTTGTWSPYGDVCTITAPGSAARHTTEAQNTIAAKAHPNPFNSGFSLVTDLPSTEKVQLKIYDMLGRLMETQEIEASDLQYAVIGEQYPSGVYNVIVSQKEVVKTIRVVKR
ncbi:T9SS type A sorting domain-containing protein [Flavobacterium sp.]|uniref:T9SS type A sorting domain-containing protein n=1 Tax=Flavobacterium sp. TaxID=239 RepID=UPI0039E65FB7